MERPIGPLDDGGGGGAKAPVSARAQPRRARAAVAAGRSTAAPVVSKPRTGKGSARAPRPAANPVPPTAPAPKAQLPRRPRATKAPEALASAPAASGPAPAAAPLAPTRRFIEPYPFDETRRRRLDGALADAGLTDAMGRAIFIGAIAYELAVLKAALAVDEPVESGAALAGADSAQLPGPSANHAAGAAPLPAATAPTDAGPSAAPQPAVPFAELAAVAADLDRLLGLLGDTGRTRLGAALRAADPFARDYGTDYLTALRLETGRLARAAGSCAAEVAPIGAARPQPAAAPPPSDNAQPATVQRFIAHAARVFQESFDRLPGSKPADPFVLALRAIAEVTDTPISTDTRLLRQALGG